MHFWKVNYIFSCNKLLLKKQTFIMKLFTLEIPAPQWTRTAPLFKSKIRGNYTLLDCTITDFKVGWNILLFCVKKRKDYVSKIRRYFQVLKTRCCSYYCLNIVLFNHLQICNSIQVSQKEGSYILACWDDYMTWLVFFLCKVIDKHLRQSIKVLINKKRLIIKV